jgi:O-antigen biosynthesis protein WbqV
VAELVAERRFSQTGTAIIVVRFGSVLGGRNGIVSRLLAQVKAGGPVSVEHTDAQRSMMRTSDAVRLLLHAASSDQKGGIFALDMGEQVNLHDLAREVIRLAGLIPGEDIQITYSGLGQGEKLSEELVEAGEALQQCGVERVKRVLTPHGGGTPALEDRIRELERMSLTGDAVGVVRQLWSMVPTFDPSTAWRRALSVASGHTGAGSPRLGSG